MTGEFAGEWNIEGVKASLQLARRGSRLKRALALLLPGLVVLGALILWLPDERQGTIGFLVVFYLVLMVFTLWLAPRQLAKSPSFQGTVHGTYSEQGMVVATGVSTVEHLWKGFAGLTSNEHAVAFKHPNGVSMAILQRWFKSDQEWQTFLLTAEKGMSSPGAASPDHPVATSPTSPLSPLTTPVPAPAAVRAATPSPLTAPPPTGKPTELDAIPFRGTWDDTAIKSVASAINPARRSRRQISMFVGLLLFLLVLLAIFPGEGQRLGGSALFISVVVGLTGLFYFGLPYLNARQMRKTLDAKTIEGLASHQGLQLKVSGAGASATHWSTYTKAIITNDAVALRFSSQPMPSMAVPRSWFANDDAWRQFVALVSQHVRS